MLRLDCSLCEALLEREAETVPEELLVTSEELLALMGAVSEPTETEALCVKGPDGEALSDTESLALGDTDGERLTDGDTELVCDSLGERVGDVDVEEQRDAETLAVDDAKAVSDAAEALVLGDGDAETDADALAVTDCD